MLKLLVLYTHLVATCVAIGMIVVTDLHMLGRAAGRNVVIPPPSRVEKRFISAALGVLYATGAGLILYGLQDRLDYLANEKLLAKLVLVGLLTLNALVLHYRVFPRLQVDQPVAAWTAGKSLLVSLSVGLSTALWLYCAFLGIARPWNFQKPIDEVLITALAMWLVVALGVRLVLAVASREAPRGKLDWVHRIKHVLGHFGPVFGEDVVCKSETVLSRISERDAPRNNDGDGAATPAVYAVTPPATRAVSLGMGARPRRLALLGWVTAIGVFTLGTIAWHFEWNGTKLLAIDTSTSPDSTVLEATRDASPDPTGPREIALNAGYDSVADTTAGTPVSDAAPAPAPAPAELLPADTPAPTMTLLPTATEQATLAEGANAADERTAPTQPVSLQFTGDCWVDIQDASKQFRLRGEMRKGAQRTLEGIPPYSLHLGNTSHVRITIAGEPFDIPNRRFTVDPARLN